MDQEKRDGEREREREAQIKLGMKEKEGNNPTNKFKPTHFKM